MLSTCSPTPPPRYSRQNKPSILFHPAGPVPTVAHAANTFIAPIPSVEDVTPEIESKMAVVADHAPANCELARRPISPYELRRAPVLTIVGIKIQCALEDFVPLARMVAACVLVRDRMDTVNLVFRDESARKAAFRILESAPAQVILEKYSQYQSYYVAWRPTADIAFCDLEPLDQPVFDERRRIYLEEDFKPPGYDYGPTGSIELPVPPPQVEHDPTLMEITSISAFFANCQPPRTPLVCPACRRLYTYIPG
ncbi:hypothetical protein JCM11491_006468 [Sporobolomyces phaffii]